MPDSKRQPIDFDSLSGLLLTLTALSGEFPTSQIDRLPSTASYKEKVIKSLKSGKLIRTYYHDGLRGLRLTAPAKKLLTFSQPDWFSPLFTGDTVTNAPKYSITHRLRLHRMAEVLVTMLNAGISAFPWEKPVIFQPTPPPSDVRIRQPAYYSSREVKELGESAIKIRNSRSTGVLLTASDIFIIYNTGPGQMKWEYKAEMRLKALLQMELCQYRLPAQFAQSDQDAIVFGSDMEQMTVLMGVGGDRRHNYFVLDGSFEHFYYLTSDHRGEVILQLLCESEQREILDAILSEDLSERRSGWVVDNDAMDGESPVLFAYTCDMPRIQHFDTALELHGKAGTLICFDFQEDALHRVCGPKVRIQCIDFDAYERSVFRVTEESG